MQKEIGAGRIYQRQIVSFEDISNRGISSLSVRVLRLRFCRENNVTNMHFFIVNI